MGRKRPPCYQCGDTDETLDEIRERRNDEVRAWGRKQLEDADALIGIAPPADLAEVFAENDLTEEQPEELPVKSRTPRAK